MQLSHTNPNQLPRLICQPPTARFLDLSFNELTGLPPTLAACSSLTALNLGFNPLGAQMPPALCRLTGLVELNLDYTGQPVRRSFNHPSTLHSPYFASSTPRFTPHTSQHTMPAFFPQTHATRQGLSAVPPEFGALSRLDALQADGCPLAAPLDALYRKNPLLLVDAFASRTTTLDLSDVSWWLHAVRLCCRRG